MLNYVLCCLLFHIVFLYFRTFKRFQELSPELNITSKTLHQLKMPKRRIEDMPEFKVGFSDVLNSKTHLAPCMLAGVQPRFNSYKCNYNILEAHYLLSSILYKITHYLLSSILYKITHYLLSSILYKITHKTY